jgi:hypothetical protein
MFGIPEFTFDDNLAIISKYSRIVGSNVANAFRRYACENLRAQLLMNNSPLIIGEWSGRRFVDHPDSKARTRGIWIEKMKR